MRSGRLSGYPESDVPTAGVAEQMNRSRSQSGDEGRDIRGVLLHGETVALPIPFFRPAMSETDGDGAVMDTERLHLACPVAIVGKRAMDEQQGRACPLLDERHVIAVHSQSRHHVP